MLTRSHLEKLWSLLQVIQPGCAFYCPTINIKYYSEGSAILSINIIFIIVSRLEKEEKKHTYCDTFAEKGLSLQHRKTKKSLKNNGTQYNQAS